MSPRTLTALVAVALVAPAAGAADVAPGARELSPTIRFLEDRTRRDPEDVVALNRLSGEYLARFRETGDDADLERAALLAEQSLKAVPAEVNVAGLAARAKSSYSLHRFAVARDDAKRLLQLDPNNRYPLEFLGDALLELGDTAEAADVYNRMARFGGADPDAGTEFRLARLALVTGKRDEAAKRFAATVERAREIHPDQPDVLPWALVEAGQFEFSSGRWDQAEAHYLESLRIKPDYWPALDHVAELRAAQGRFDEAVSIYVKLVGRVARPELFQALGDVYRAMNAPDAARPWHARAEKAYLDAAKRGSAHYFHHLAGFYCDVDSKPTEAIRWAKEDLNVRHTTQAHDALAWALYHKGDHPAAAAAMDAALKPGTADAHVLYHASLIYARTGRAESARDCLRRAGAANPKFMSFHVHR